MPGIDEVIIKGAGPEGGGDDNNKKFNVKNLKEQLLKDKRTRYAALSVIGFIVGVPLIFKLVGGGTTVQVQQGLTKQQVKETVEQTLQPVISQLQKQNQNQNQVAQANNQPSQSTSTNQSTQSTKQNSSETKNSSKTSSQQSTQNQSPPLASILGLGQPSKTKQQNLPQSPPTATGSQATNYPPTGYTPPLSSPMGMGLPTEMKPPAPPEPKMVFMEMPVPKQQNNGYGYGPTGTTEKKSQKKSVYIPAGSIVAGELMYGFTAPERGVLPPVVIKITKPIWTANNWYMPFQECLITTKAQYNISENLAQVGGKGSTLSCVLPNGHVIETPVDVAIGEDLTTSNGHYEVATIGLRGKEKWLTGKQMAEIAGMYGLQGFANALQNLQTNQEITTSGTVITTLKNSAEYSIAGGVGQAINGFLQFWLKQYNNKVPAIEVPPKKVFIVFVQGAKLDMSPYKEVLP
jgi:hypothetical protein